MSVSGRGALAHWRPRLLRSSDPSRSKIKALLHRCPQSPELALGTVTCTRMHSRNLNVSPRRSPIEPLATFQIDYATRRKRTTDMRFLERLFGEFCSHQFTWPRLDGNGQHYQICLTCGNAYEYDWKRMRRTDRLLATNGHPHLASARTRLPGAGKLM